MRRERTYRLERQQWIERPVDQVFDFFSRAENLQTLTPPWLHFRMQTPLAIELCSGALIDYRIRLAGIPMSWRTRIDDWEPGVRFIDVQERGPYRQWVHLHEFQAVANGVVMTDRVDYRLPLGPLGRIAHALAVRAALAAIFDYRFQRIRELHPESAA